MVYSFTGNRNSRQQSSQDRETRTTNMEHHKSLLGAFEVLPVEIIQQFMCHLHLKSLLNVASLSSQFYAIFTGAENVIIHHAITNEIGQEAIQAATTRYACSIPDLKADMDILVDESPTSSTAVTMEFRRNRTVILDATRFNIPKSIFTLPAAHEIISFHERVMSLVNRYSEWMKSEVARDEKLASLTLPHREQVVRMQLILYAAQTARLLSPGEYREVGADEGCFITVTFGKLDVIWAYIRNLPEHGPPFTSMMVKVVPWDPPYSNFFLSVL
ncbi:hypothetical protein F4677DRAFT_429140 [Hypoxylon crocopeplum]|nr:hypothetical protein F4677DRAFT_429140 [Hypoxylon crocopeplum]